jgi:(1->4)-alpha-D-glucan 1-alpha-D-glucosylmutase
VLRRPAAQLLETWQDGGVKMLVTASLLELRKRRASWFERATYRPVRVRGAHKNSVCAFMRVAGGSHLLCAVPRLWQGIVTSDATWPVGDDEWADTTLVLDVPVAQWRNVITGEVQRPLVERAGARLAVGAALATFPVAVFEEM